MPRRGGAKEVCKITLREIKAIDREIHRLKSRLGTLESSVYNTSPSLSGAPPGSESGDRVGRAACEIVDINIDIQALELRKSMAINKLDLSRFEDNCLYMRLKLRLSWAQIAAKVGSTPDSIKMMCHRYSW